MGGEKKECAYYCSRARATPSRGSGTSDGLTGWSNSMGTTCCLRCFGKEFFSTDGVVCCHCPDIGVEGRTYQTVEHLSLKCAMLWSSKWVRTADPCKIKVWKEVETCNCMKKLFLFCFFGFFAPLKVEKVNKLAAILRFNFIRMLAMGLFAFSALCS